MKHATEGSWRSCKLVAARSEFASTMLWSLAFWSSYALILRLRVCHTPQTFSSCMRAPRPSGSPFSSNYNRFVAAQSGSGAPRAIAASTSFPYRETNCIPLISVRRARYYLHVRRGQMNCARPRRVELAGIEEAAKEATRRGTDITASKRQMMFPPSA